MRQIIDFLLRRVMGKALYTDELVYQLEDGALMGVYSDQMSFSNLRWSSTGFSFDLTVVSREHIYEMAADGARGPLRQDFSGTALFRYELARRRSSNQVTGIFRFISASNGDATSEALASAIYDLTFADDSLAWTEQQMLYRDQPSGGKSFRPVTFDAKCKLYFVEEKLYYLYDAVCYDVDPETMARNQANATYPRFISKER